MPYKTRRAFIASICLAVSATLAYTFTPRKKISQQNGGINLENAIPIEFANWKLDRNSHAGVINPQTEQLIKATYNQTLSRVYLNAQGQRIMLSIAYAEDQTDSGNEIHHPEVCYPAQGFSIKNQAPALIKTNFGSIRANRLITSLGSARVEPVTYWIIIGREIALTAKEKRLAELRHGLRGEIVDGTLFRTSTIDADVNQSYAVQDQFIDALTRALTPLNRKRLTALD